MLQQHQAHVHNSLHCNTVVHTFGLLLQSLLTTGRAIPAMLAVPIHPCIGNAGGGTGHSTRRLGLLADQVRAGEI